MEDGNFWLSPRYLEHRPVTSPPTNQKKVAHLAALTPNFAFDCSSLVSAFSPFPGSGGDHPVRSPVWPLPVSAAYKVYV